MFQILEKKMQDCLTFQTAVLKFMKKCRFSLFLDGCTQIHEKMQDFPTLDGFTQILGEKMQDFLYLDGCTQILRGKLQYFLSI